MDADLANNSMGWQWVAGSGFDAAPYFRIFNPTLQSEKFDEEGIYIRMWVPELSRLPNRYIHKPSDAPEDVLKKANITLGTDYPYPLVDHKAARNRALAHFEEIK
ncbi:FAD-binding domain-containing protein [Bacillus sp. es.034]|uniref:FAD-binding domain-containing protein n=1 Tax=Bacillus sp. es.034 TaxID=1761763 RepID=UPI00256FBD74|nr:FAD-binding domain-containing protein [Bacillus sp. es.034]